MYAVGSHAGASFYYPFSCELFRNVGAAGGNLLLSPHSISTALAMVRAGASGETAEQMDTVLRLPPDAEGAFSNLVSALAGASPILRIGTEKRWMETPVYELVVANGIFCPLGELYSPSFRRTVVENFRAEFRELDFARSAEARAAIDRWVEETTMERIKDLLPAGVPTPETRMVLANAIYFKAAWWKPFIRHFTVDGPFWAASDRVVPAKRMRRTGYLNYSESPDAQVLEIPYVRHDTAMTIVLPRAQDGLDGLVARMTPEMIQSWTSALKGAEVALELPRFTFTSSLDLAPVLMRMGMVDAFSPLEADFSRITRQEPFFIGAALHKAFIAVDEAGTEAAAATMFGQAMACEDSGRQEPIRFIVDHPFLILVRHTKTGAILFLGRVTDPTMT